MTDDKVLDLNQTVYDLCKTNPELTIILKEIGFAEITKPGMLQSAGRFMTIPKGAAMKGIELDSIEATLKQKGYTIVSKEASS